MLGELLLLHIAFCHMCLFGGYPLQLPFRDHRLCSPLTSLSSFWRHGREKNETIECLAVSAKNGVVIFRWEQGL